MDRSFPTITQRVAPAQAGLRPQQHDRRSGIGLLIMLLLFTQYQWLPDLLPTLLPAGQAQAQAFTAPLACQELLTNGDLETSGGWTYGPTPAPGSVVNTPTQSGAFAMRLGIATGANVEAYSTAYQAVSLPATAQQLVLTYWERAGTTGDSSDFREAVLLRPDFSSLRSLGRQTGGGSDQWTARSVDFSDLRGQNVVLYFNVYNNGSGATLVNYLDQISLQSCDSTATATSTPTPLATATLTAPSPTATLTPQPSNLTVSAAQVTVAVDSTTVHARVDLRGAADITPVGVLSLNVAYDPAVLSATACTVNAGFDLLLCNMGTPGLIQLAGVAANGIRADAMIADLDFAIVQPTNLNTQLTVQIETITDLEGAALTATTQHGQVGAPCRPGAEGCPAIPFYLPLVQR